jgi:transposase
MKSIPNSLHRDIVARLENGKYYQKIAAELHVSKSLVGEVRSRIHLEVQRSLGGHPKKLSPQDRCQLTRFIASGQADNASQLKRTTGHGVTTQTIRNALKEEGMKACVKTKKPLLKKSHIKARLEFARKHQHWTVEDWY